MLPSSDIFRAYDIRGVVTDQLTPAAVEQIGRSFGSECRDRDIRQVIVARDGRLSGPVLVQALTSGLQAAGIDVIDIGMVPTPVLYYATCTLETDTGIMVTGSHNPPDYNGLKMVMSGAALYGDHITALHKRLAENRLHSGAGSRREKDVMGDYLQRIVGDVRLQRRLRIGYDCGNGVAGTIAPQLFEALGCDASGLYVDVDGNFPNHHPDPARLDNLTDLQALIRDQQLDIGLAFDGDGDRVGVIDDQGKVIWPDRQMVLFARDVLSRNPGGRIIYDVKCSRVLPAAIEQAGGVPDMWKTGHSLIKARLKQTGALLGGEMSGHLFFSERWYGFDDALYSAARLLEILAASDRPASELFGEIPDSVNTPELNVLLPRDGAQHEFVAAFAQHADFDGAHLTTIDGVRADFEDGWGLVRASNTTPSLVIRFEADSEAAMHRIQTLFRTAMQRTDAAIELPF